jgi:Skp family chaperone for outer membrane proteins
MKVFRTTVAIIALATFAILAHTQTRPTTPAAGAPASAPQTRPAAPGNIAVIDSSAFGDDKQGIARVTVAMRQLETKFQPLRNELRGMRDRLNTMRADIQKKQGIQDAQMTAKQAEEADKLDLEIKRKAEDAQASYQKESVALLDPLQKDIADALTAYAQAKGISLLFDLNRVPVIYAANNLDITKDFIAEYNRTHPAAAAPARPTRP